MQHFHSSYQRNSSAHTSHAYLIPVYNYMCTDVHLDVTGEICAYQTGTTFDSSPNACYLALYVVARA